MKKILTKLFEHQKLTHQEAYEALQIIASENCNEAEMSAFMTVFAMRPIEVEELRGFRKAMLDLCLPLEIKDFETIDLCGTGGDGKNTFNISTVSSFVVAGAGLTVSKHGNNGVSSFCGSSNILEALGFKFTNDIAILKKMLAEANICFLHAPLFHPAMKRIAPVRKALGFKTFFNMLGPMSNPAQPKFQMVGVFSLELLRLYDYIYQTENTSYLIVHSLDGYDEISLTGKFRASNRQGTQVLEAEDIGLKTIKAEEIASGKTLKEASEIFMNVLKDDATEAQKNVVLANAGGALLAGQKAADLQTAVALAKESIESGKALETFKKCREISQTI